MMEAADAARTVAGMEGGALDSAEPCSGLVGEGRGSYRQRLSCIAVASSWATGSGTPDRLSPPQRSPVVAGVVAAGGGEEPRGEVAHGEEEVREARAATALFAQGVVVVTTTASRRTPRGTARRERKEEGRRGGEVGEQRRGGEAAGVIVLLAGGHGVGRQGVAAAPTAAWRRVGVGWEATGCTVPAAGVTTLRDCRSR